MTSVHLYLKKTGSPIDQTVKVVTQGGDGLPTTTLVDANATATLTAAMLTTSLAWVTITFPGSFTITPNNWLILESTGAEDAANYVSWGAGAGGAGFLGRQSYSTGTWAVATPNALDFWIPGTVELDAHARGAWGNALALADTGAAISVSGAALSGGVDGPAGYIDYETGVQTFEYVGDNWTQGETDALTAVTDVVLSEFGLFWAARDGTLTFRDHHYTFELANTAAVMTVPGTGTDAPTGMQGILSKDDVINRAVISYTPRQLSAVQVVAKSGQVIGVPGRFQGFNPRWRRTQAITAQAGERTVILPYTDPATGERSGATELVQPLAATTDYKVYDTAATSGFEYTTSSAIKFSLALAASGVQIHIDNGLIGKVYIHNLQIRGKTLEHQDPTQILVEDTTSQTSYGVKPYDYNIPYPSANIDDFALLLGQHFVNRYLTPQYLVSSISFMGVQTVGGASVWALELGNPIAVSESQTAISSQKFMIIGLEYQLPEEGVETVTAYLMRLDDHTYWAVGTAGYSELGSTTRLAL
jgi:hypothetical protein